MEKWSCADAACFIPGLGPMWARRCVLVSSLVTSYAVDQLSDGRGTSDVSAWLTQPHAQLKQSHLRISHRCPLRTDRGQQRQRTRHVALLGGLQSLCKRDAFFKLHTDTTASEQLCSFPKIKSILLFVCEGTWSEWQTVTAASAMQRW